MITEPSWLHYPVVKNHLQGYGLHVDVVNHYSKRLNEADVITDTHETTHMINADIRNQHKGHNNAFYIGLDRAVVFPEPSFRKSKISSYIPSNLRGMRYSTYITGQREWEDSPLYIYDEWSAYINGGQTAIEQYKGNWTDGVSGCLEFSIYAIALCMATPGQYFTQNPDFLIYTKYQLNRSKYIYDRGSAMDVFKWEKQDKMLQELQNTQQYISFITHALDGIWLQ